LYSKLYQSRIQILYYGLCILEYFRIVYYETENEKKDKIKILKYMKVQEEIMVVHKKMSFVEYSQY